MSDNRTVARSRSRGVGQAGVGPGGPPPASRDTRRDTGGTVSLKALAVKALRRDTTRDNSGTPTKITVPLPETPPGHFFERVSPPPPSQAAPPWTPEDW